MSATSALLQLEHPRTGFRQRENPLRLHMSETPPGNESQCRSKLDEPSLPMTIAEQSKETRSLRNLCRKRSSLDAPLLQTIVEQLKHRRNLRNPCRGRLDVPLLPVTIVLNHRRFPKTNFSHYPVTTRSSCLYVKCDNF